MNVGAGVVVTALVVAAGFAVGFGSWRTGHHDPARCHICRRQKRNAERNNG
jgi:hypothetical protein